MNNINDKIRKGINFKYRDFIISDMDRHVNKKLSYDVKTILWYGVQTIRIGNWSSVFREKICKLM